MLVQDKAMRGACVVLAARTKFRLGEVARDVTALGRRRMGPYKMTMAAGTDLRRLPAPDEIADALASPMARAMTGQRVDVVCGEYRR